VRRLAPRHAAGAVQALAEALAPQTPLAAVQRVWEAAAGELVAAQAHPTAVRDGVVTVTCSSAVWAQELDLMGCSLTARLTELLGEGRVRSLRCQAAPAKAWAREASER
jgi:predicted nucleic acid-binding Zn ribbon protein